MKPEGVGNRLREIRRLQRHGQALVANVLEVSVSEVSRLERGGRVPRLASVPAWAKALRHRCEVVFVPDVDGSARDLDPQAEEVLNAVAAALPHMPQAARDALVFKVRQWGAGSSR